jgi:hypothetical protein
VRESPTGPRDASWPAATCEAGFSHKDAERCVTPIGISLEVVFRRLDVVYRKNLFFCEI